MIIVIWLFVTVFTGAVCAQQTIPAQPSDLVLHDGTREVLLDFVVRDKHQRKVKDIPKPGTPGTPLKVATPA